MANNESELCEGNGEWWKLHNHHHPASLITWVYSDCMFQPHRDALTRPVSISPEKKGKPGKKSSLCCAGRSFIHPPAPTAARARAFKGPRRATRRASLRMEMRVFRARPLEIPRTALSLWTQLGSFSPRSWRMLGCWRESWTGAGVKLEQGWVVSSELGAEGVYSPLLERSEQFVSSSQRIIVNN